MPAVEACCLYSITYRIVAANYSVEVDGVGLGIEDAY